MTSPRLESFLCTIDTVLDRIERIDPVAYNNSRNYLDGSVTWLSPFVTHGISNTQEIAQQVLQKYSPPQSSKLLFELGWREYFHRTWQHAQDGIFDDIRHAQSSVVSDRLPAAVVNANTGINTVDHALNDLYADGVMHNHARMWVAAIVCNQAQTHWYEAARFLHYHLLDGDLASNTLSWQWVAGTFSNKQYVANQDNINKYSRGNQHDTWLDVPYEALLSSEVPAVLQERADYHYITAKFGEPVTPLTGEIALRSIWQLNPRWQSEIKQHIVFIDTDWLAKWPLSPNRIAFIQHWAHQCNARLLVGSLEELTSACIKATIIREEYPACAQWPGVPQERPWLFPVPEKPLSSFSRYFKEVKSCVGL